MVGVDATSVQQKAITDGQELGTVSQDPYDIGYQTIIVAAQAMVYRSGTGGFCRKKCSA